MRKFCFILSIFVFLVGLSIGILKAQEVDSPGKAALSDPAELEAFLDGVMTAHMEAYHIAGAAVAVVKDRQLFFAKGYGFADVEKKKPVIAEKTLFRTGSTGKLFTWAAVMQLVEKGLIDLDVDINTYLKKFKVPQTFPEPITMTHLLSHTPGFEDLFSGLATRVPEDITPLADYLAKNMPARVRPPGKLTAYSNYGTALAGYIVELVSGIPFEKYVADNIFNPLDMKQSTFYQPPPATLAENMSKGYMFKDGWFEAKDFELFRSLAPAGTMSCTVQDMARFMIAQLNLGEYAGNRILKEDTVRRMHSRLFANDPKTTGNAHGFWEQRYNNLFIIDHGGDTLYFHTLLALIPEQDIGFYVAYNTLPERNPRYPLLKAFLDRYFPGPGTAEVKPLPTDKASLNRFSGYFGFTRASFTTYEKVVGLFSPIHVKTTDDGKLLAFSRQWMELEPLVFREMGGQDTLVFREDEKGKISHMFLSWVPHAACTRLAGSANPVFHYILLALCGILFLSTWRWPLSALFRKLCCTKKEKGSEPLLARLLAGAMATLYILTMLGVLVVLSDPNDLFFGDLSLLKILLLFPLISVVLTIGAAVYAFLAWKNKYWTGCQRLHYTLVVLASLVFIWFLNYWNLLGFRF